VKQLTPYNARIADIGLRAYLPDDPGGVHRTQSLLSALRPATGCSHLHVTQLAVASAMIPADTSLGRAESLVTI
jgi:hypothetical protein